MSQTTHPRRSPPRTAPAAPRKTPKPATLVERFWNNVARLPGRTWRGLIRLGAAEFRLEREAQRVARQKLPLARRMELDRVPGMSSDHECQLLAYLAYTAPRGGEVVEIGAWMGRTTAWLVEGVSWRADRPGIHSIDPHQRASWDGFCDTVARLDLKDRGLSVYRAPSHDVGRTWNRPIGLLWIDGCHEYDAVTQDIDDFVPHVLPGGWVVFDDAAGGHFPGVERAVAEKMFGRPNFRHEGTLRHLQLFRRLG